MSGAELHELRRARKRRAFPLPSDACRFLGWLGMNQPHAIGQVTFSLRRSKRGVQIMFFAPTETNLSFSWNVSHYQGRQFQTFAEARKWVEAYAAGYGQTVTERVKERSPRGRRTDSQLLRAGGCRESWLKSDVPTLYAEAMMRCQHPAAFCSEDGYCHYGDCKMEMVPSPTK